MNVHSRRTSVRLAVPCAAFILISIAVQGAVSSVSISGTPTTSVDVGQEYSFVPRASVQGSGAPRFEIVNLPRWATFSSFNGRLSGVPSSADAGVHPAIRIAISDGSSRAELPSFSIVVQGMPATRSVSISWQPPLENTDGTVLTDLAGYRIYSGPSRESLALRASLANPSLSRYVVESLDAGQHYFALSAVNAAGRESPLSTVVGAVIE